MREACISGRSTGRNSCVCATHMNDDTETTTTAAGGIPVHVEIGGSRREHFLVDLH